MSAPTLRGPARSSTVYVFCECVCFCELCVFMCVCVVFV
jgi:hypothetical protein